MTMDFGSEVADANAVSVADEAQMRSAVDGLDEMEAMLREGDSEKLIGQLGGRRGLRVAMGGK